MAVTRAMSHGYKDFSVCDLTAQIDDGRYRACAAVVGQGESRTLSQRFLDFGTFESEAEATARAQAGARAWVHEELLPLAQEILERDGNHMAALGVSLHMRHVPPVVGYI